MLFLVHVGAFISSVVGNSDVRKYRHKNHQ
jgi:hypothetical protein